MGRVVPSRASSCRPLLERVVAEYDGAVVLAKVDVDANPRISQAFGVQSIPTVVAVAGGQPVDAFAGALPEPQVRAWIQRLVDALQGPAARDGRSARTPASADPVDPLIVQAEQAMEEGDFDAAIAAYEQLQRRRPGRHRGQAGRRAAAVPAARARAAGRTRCERAAADPATCRPSWTPPTLLFASGRPEAAYEAWSPSSSPPRRRRAGPGAASSCWSCSSCTGTSDPLVIKYRRRLAAAHVLTPLRGAREPAPPEPAACPTSGGPQPWRRSAAAGEPVDEPEQRVDGRVGPGAHQVERLVRVGQSAAELVRPGVRTPPRSSDRSGSRHRGRRACRAAAASTVAAASANSPNTWAARRRR